MLSEALAALHKCLREAVTKDREQGRPQSDALMEYSDEWREMPRKLHKLSVDLIRLTAGEEDRTAEFWECLFNDSNFGRLVMKRQSSLI